MGWAGQVPITHASPLPETTSGHAFYSVGPHPLQVVLIYSDIYFDPVQITQNITQVHHTMSEETYLLLTTLMIKDKN